MTLVDGIASNVEPVGTVVAIVVLGLTAGIVAAVVGFLTRAYSREASPEALNVLVGLGAIAVWLNLTGSLGNFLEGEARLVTASSVAVNVVSLTAGAFTSLYGGKLGDRAAVELSTISKASYDGEVTKMVRSVGRTVTVEIPSADAIDDIDCYDPVTEDTKEKLAGRRLLFPRGVTVAELRERVAERLKEDYEVGYVDLELTRDGDVEFLGLGRSASGIGPTLPPGKRAVAVRADPAHSSGPGDSVQIWRESPEPERVADGEVYARAGDVVTVALDEKDAAKLEPSVDYRLVTLPSEKGPERRFASMLRSADETVSVLTVSGNSPLVGTEVGDVGVPVVAVRAPDGDVEAVPPRSRVLSESDELYVVGRPEELRRLGASLEGG